MSQLGAPRTLTAISPIRLAEGYRTDLPDPVYVKTDFTTFDKTYRYAGKDVVIERTIVVLAKKLPKTDWKRYQGDKRTRYVSPKIAAIGMLSPCLL
jgi:hypothetical protein